MHEAFVENAEHDVDRDDRRQNQPGLPGQRARELIGIAGVATNHRGGHAYLLLRLADGGYRIAERSTVREIEADGDGGELVLVKDGERCRPALDLGNRAQWHLSAARTWYVQPRQRVGIVLVLRHGLQHHAILVRLGVNGGDLPLAEGVVERVIDRLHGNAKSTGHLAVDAYHRS